MSLEEKVIDYLMEQDDYVKTLQIAKAVCGKSGTRKSVNPTLYKLLRDNVVEKISEENGTNPKWKTIKFS